MKKLFAVTALTITGMTGAAFADALDDAEERGVCGVGFEPISAEYLPDGRLKALCPAGSGAAAAAAGSTVVGGAGGAGVRVSGRHGRAVAHPAAELAGKGLYRHRARRARHRLFPVLRDRAGPGL